MDSLAPLLAYEALGVLYEPLRVGLRAVEGQLVAPRGVVCDKRVRDLGDHLLVAVRRVIRGVPCCRLCGHLGVGMWQSDCRQAPTKVDL